MCDNHFSVCKICDKEGYKKACLKKCTYKCSFCDNMNNELCSKKNHEKNFVQRYNCEHNICLTCVKKCEKCQKIVKSCLRCTVDYYFIHCNFCDKYKCFDCGKQCKTCEDYFCDYAHICNLCNGVIKENTCLKCITNSRVKCSLCKKSLRQCDECRKFLVCSQKCYLDNKHLKNNKHICQMFLCDECIKKGNLTNNIDNITNIINNINNIDNIDDMKDKDVQINTKVKQFINNNNILNNNTSGRKINNNNNNNKQLDVFNNQTYPISPNGNIVIDDDRKNKANIKGEKRKVLCCCESCAIF